MITMFTTLREKEIMMISVGLLFAMMKILVLLDLPVTTLSRCVESQSRYELFRCDVESAVNLEQCWGRARTMILCECSEGSYVLRVLEVI